MNATWYYITRREARINAPELNSAKPYHVRQAKHTRSVARQLCPPGSIVTITTSKNKRDLYARYTSTSLSINIAEIIYNGQNVYDFLLQKGCVKEVKGQVERNPAFGRAFIYIRLSTNSMSALAGGFCKFLIAHDSIERYWEVF